MSPSIRGRKGRDALEQRSCLEGEADKDSKIFEDRTKNKNILCKGDRDKKESRESQFDESERSQTDRGWQRSDAGGLSLLRALMGS